MTEQITKGSILDYVTKTIIDTPLPSLDISELGKVLVIKKVETAPINTDIQIITDPETQLDNLRLAFQYGLNSVGYLEQVDLDLSSSALNDYFSIVLSGFTIDPITFDKGVVNGVIYINQNSTNENILTKQKNISVTFGGDDKLSIIQATLYAINMQTSNYRDLQYVEITTPLDNPANIGEAEILKEREINFVYNDLQYGKRLALSLIGGVSGYKSYLDYKLTKELKYNHFSFANSQKPYNSRTLKTLLEKDQEAFVINNYGNLINQGASYLINNKDVGLQTWDCEANWNFPEAIWFFNLKVKVE